MKAFTHAAEQVAHLSEPQAVLGALEDGQAGTYATLLNRLRSPSLPHLPVHMLDVSSPSAAAGLLFS